MANAHNVENYTIGKGILYIGTWVGTTPPATVTKDLGNAPSAEVEPAVERLPHMSSRSGYKTKDKNPIIESTYMVNFDLDEMSAYNMNLYLMGTLSGGNEVKGLQAANTEYALKFAEDNPAGPNKTHLFHRGTLSPNGPLQLIGDEWLVMSMQFEGLADVANNAASPYFTTTYATTTTTTTA
jgi:hypothetical protein